MHPDQLAVERGSDLRGPPQHVFAFGGAGKRGNDPLWRHDRSGHGGLGSVATVVLPTGFARELDYLVPDALRESLEPGRRVRVPEVIPETPAEKRHYADALLRREHREAEAARRKLEKAAHSTVEGAEGAVLYSTG